MLSTIVHICQYTVLRTYLPSIRLLEVTFSIEVTNFDPNEPSTSGKSIWKRGLVKIGFWQLRPPLMTWLAGRLAGWQALLLPLEFFDPNRPLVKL